MPGWIALRYLNDPATAHAHFAHIDDGSANPIVLARANYWRGRAAEAIGDSEEMRAAMKLPPVTHRLLRTARARQARP
jgi:soluble lytic murein transglycosylase